MTPDQVQRAKALLDARQELLEWLAVIDENSDCPVFKAGDIYLRRPDAETLIGFDAALEIPSDLMRDMLTHGIERCTIDLAVLGVSDEPAKEAA